MKKLLLADDHPIFRKGLRDILENTFERTEIIECENGPEALQKIVTANPDVAILDIDMPGMNGLDVAKAVLGKNSTTRIIILTMYREKEMIKKAMLSGASGYLLKDFAVQELIDCIDKVSKGQNYIGPALEPHYHDVSQQDKQKQELLHLLKLLSQAEVKTLKLVSQNLTTREIAERLFLSEKTVENYRSRICQKLNLPPRNNSLMLWIGENRDLLSSISEF